jgi:GTP-binding protein HflX
VGFIRKLPHHLIASFKSTLEEVQEADLLLHVVDISHPHYDKQMQTVLKILEELNARSKNILTVFNKIDKLEEPKFIHSVQNLYPDASFVSAIRHIGLEKLKTKIINFIELNFVRMEIQVPVQDQKFIHYIHTIAQVDSQVYEDDHIHFQLRCDSETCNKIKSQADERNFKLKIMHLDKEVHP